jgi:hypothetical protein
MDTERTPQDGPFELDVISGDLDEIGEAYLGQVEHKSVRELVMLAGLEDVHIGDAAVRVEAWDSGILVIDERWTGDEMVEDFAGSIAHALAGQYFGVRGESLAAFQCAEFERYGENISGEDWLDDWRDEFAEKWLEEVGADNVRAYLAQRLPSRD